MLKATAQIDSRNIFVLLGSFAGLALAFLLLRDGRLTDMELVGLGCGMAICACTLIFNMRVWAPRSVGLAAVGLGGVAFVTYPIGGLAFLMPAALVAFSLVAKTRRRWLVNGVGWAAFLTLAFGAVDPGGLGFIAAPLLLPLIVWAAARSRRIAHDATRMAVRGG